MAEAGGTKRPSKRRRRGQHPSRKTREDGRRRRHHEKDCSSYSRRKRSRSTCSLPLSHLPSVSPTSLHADGATPPPPPVRARSRSRNRREGPRTDRRVRRGSSREFRYSKHSAYKVRVNWRPSRVSGRDRSSSVSSTSSSVDTETEDERRERWTMRWEEEGWNQPDIPDFPNLPGRFDPLTGHRVRRAVLAIEYWDRTPSEKARKQAHMDALDAQREVTGVTREFRILSTTLLNSHVALERNMFPYETPEGISHWTLWARTYMREQDVEHYVESWLDANQPNIVAWAFDPSNLSEGMSIDLYHVHVYFYDGSNTETGRVTLLPSEGTHRADTPPFPASSNAASPW